MAKDRIPDGASRGSERQAGSLFYIALGRLCGPGTSLCAWLPSSCPSGTKYTMRRSRVHLSGWIGRTGLYTMVLVLLSVFLSAIVIAISTIRHHLLFGSLTRSGIASGEFSAASQLAQQSRIAGPMKQFLVVVLPDGRIVTTTLGE